MTTSNNFPFYTLPFFASVNTVKACSPSAAAFLKHISLLS